MDGGAKHDKFAKVRERMIQHDLLGRDITDPEVLAAMSEIRREDFVPEAYKFRAYDDGPLPIDMGQTISQPYIVALMTQHLRLNRDCEVLEVGTGSGYQTAILSRLAKKVCTIERYEQLSQSAQAVLAKLGITNVEFRVGDGSCGWPEEKIFDRIIITATVPAMPKPLLDQLVESGLIIAPVGAGGVQELVVGRKKGERAAEMVICDCRFVKLIGKYGFEE